MTILPLIEYKRDPVRVEVLHEEQDDRDDKDEDELDPYQEEHRDEDGVKQAQQEDCRHHAGREPAVRGKASAWRQGAQDSLTSSDQRNPRSSAREALSCGTVSWDGTKRSTGTGLPSDRTLWTNRVSTSWNVASSLASRAASSSWSSFSKEASGCLRARTDLLRPFDLWCKSTSFY